VTASEQEKRYTFYQKFFDDVNTNSLLIDIDIIHYYCYRQISFTIIDKHRYHSPLLICTDNKLCIAGWCCRMLRVNDLFKRTQKSRQEYLASFSEDNTDESYATTVHTYCKQLGQKKP